MDLVKFEPFQHLILRCLALQTVRSRQNAFVSSTRGEVYFIMIGSGPTKLFRLILPNLNCFVTLVPS